MEENDKDKSELDLLSKAFEIEGYIDKEAIVYFHDWINSDLNRTKAYLLRRPNVSVRSAAALGSKMLAKIDVKSILAACGLTRERYFEELNNGLNAMRFNKETGKPEPDHKTRLPYLKELGKLLGVGKAYNFGQFDPEREIQRVKKIMEELTTEEIHHEDSPLQGNEKTN